VRAEPLGYLPYVRGTAMDIRRVLSRKAGAAGAALLAGGLALSSTVALSGTADAAPCSGLTGLAGSCTTTGTITINAGGLTVGAPASLSWTASITGAAQTIYDTSTNDEILYTSDLRGLASTNGSAGWKVTATATTFTGGTGATLADTAGGQLLAFGGGAAGADTNVPTAACVVVLTCTPAATSVTGYPLFVPTGASATPTKIYNASATTGQGIGQVGGNTATHPAVWQVDLPSVITADTYTSTVTVTIAASPLRAAAAGRRAGGGGLPRPANRSAVARERGGTR
jgi:hypothetical protein